MYRRRNIINNKVNEEKKVEKKEIKEEPVIKAVYKPRQVTAPYGNAPMLNVLRPINYFENNDGHYVPFNKMVDIVFSEGYLNVKDTEYYKESSKYWREAFTDTTDYERSTFMPGDLIYTHNGHISYAFLINAVYPSFDINDPKSFLDYNPPVGGNPEEDPESKYLLQSFNACNGYVYMFKHGTTLEKIKEYISVYKSGTEQGKYRKLIPSNLSEPTNNEEPADYTFNRRSNKKDEAGTPPQGYPQASDLPKSSTTKQFNLQEGVCVEGWLIYMTSTAEPEGTEVQKPSNIRGDIVKSGKIIITKVGDYLSLGGICRFPYIDSTATEPKGKFYYNGENTRVAAEPLNSEHFQQNYGDEQGERDIEVLDLVLNSQ